jgi:hypothetical protein
VVSAEVGGDAMSEYTKGPWKLAEMARCNFDSARFIRSENEGTDYGAVAVVALGSDNARLIAAAPELLEALRQWMGYWCGAEDAMNDSEREMYDATVSAIDKAEGK